ncbi:MAG: hypothetical protein WDN28_25640 [Chthoniobacter sp.]
MNVESNMLEQVYRISKRDVRESYRWRGDPARLSRRAACPGHAASAAAFADNTFDLVYSNAVLEHAGRPGAAALFPRRIVPRGAAAICSRCRIDFFPVEHHHLPSHGSLPSKPTFRRLLRGTRYDVWSHEENLNYISAAQLRALWARPDPGDYIQRHRTRRLSLEPGGL